MAKKPEDAALNRHLKERRARREEESFDRGHRTMGPRHQSDSTMPQLPLAPMVRERRCVRAPPAWYVRFEQRSSG